MALRSEDVEVNLVRTSGLVWRPNLMMWVWSWVSFGKVLQSSKRAKQSCSAALFLLVVVLGGGGNVCRTRNGFTLEGKDSI